MRATTPRAAFVTSPGDCDPGPQTLAHDESWGGFRRRARGGDVRRADSDEVVRRIPASFESQARAPILHVLAVRHSPAGIEQLAIDRRIGSVPIRTAFDAPRSAVVRREPGDVSADLGCEALVHAT
jgi:hypothetical protein